MEILTCWVIFKHFPLFYVILAKGYVLKTMFSCYTVQLFSVSKPVMKEAILVLLSLIDTQGGQKFSSLV